MKRRPQLPLLRPAERPQRSFEPLDAVVIGLGTLFLILLGIW